MMEPQMQPAQTTKPSTKKSLMDSYKFEWRSVFLWLKYFILFTFVAFLALGGYAVWSSYQNSPLRVRITNVTGRSATVSWVTEKPTKGVVAYAESGESFLPSILTKYGKKVAFDDRDVANAVLDRSEDIAKTGDIGSENLEDYDVKKFGSYYVHHVTIPNLEEETEYIFRIGDGLVFWDSNEDFNVDGFEWIDFANEFKFSTFKDPEELSAPDPAYGRVYSLIDEDGVLSDNPSVDSLVFVVATKEEDSSEGLSLPLSSITNLDGGWSVDKANFRDLNGLPVKDYVAGQAAVYVMTEFENTNETREVAGIWGETDSPMEGVYYDLESNSVTSFSNSFVLGEVSAQERKCGVASCGDPTCICQQPGGGWEPSGGNCLPASCVNEKRPGQSQSDVCPASEQRCVTGNPGTVKKNTGLPLRDDTPENNGGKGASVGRTDTTGASGGKAGVETTPVTTPSQGLSSRGPAVGSTCDLPNKKGGGTINSKGECIGSEPYEAARGTVGVLASVPKKIINTVVNTYDETVRTVREVEAAIITAAAEKLGEAVNCAVNFCLLTGAVDIVVDVAGRNAQNVTGLMSSSAGSISEWFGTVSDLWGGVNAAIIEIRAEPDTDSMFIGKAYADETVLKSAQSGDDYIVYFPEDGVYDVNIPGIGNANVVGVSGMPYLFFINRDGKDGFQEPSDINNPQPNEDILVKLTGFEVKVGKTASVFDVKLSKGINIVSFPFMPADSDKNPIKASQFLDVANRTAKVVTAITYFDSGKWSGGLVHESSDSGAYSGIDFPLTFGKGYLVLSDREVTIKLSGYSVESPVPVAFKSGWNLVGVHGYRQGFTAKTLIDSVNGIPGLTSDNVTWYPTSKGRYEGFQKSEGVEYGLDFPIANNLGYFVKVIKFSPDTAETKSILWQPGGDLHGVSGSGNN